MPHINIKCYPKHLNAQQMENFIDALEQVVRDHLNASSDAISIDYNEIEPENWKTVYDTDIKPHLETLAKRPHYEI